MRPLIYSILYCLFVVALFSCTITLTGIRPVPDYNGVDPQIAPYANSWMDLAQKYNLKFEHKVTIGFKDINDGPTVGLTNFGVGFREIDVDKEYWKDSTTIGKTILVWHELGHAYCNRMHDYKNGKEYKSAKEAIKDPDEKDGFFEDKCPITLMFPSIMEDDCFKFHYNDYVREMFGTCKPY